MGPKSNNRHSHMRQKKRRHTEMQGRGHVRTGRDWSDAVTTQATPGAARSQKKQRRIDSLLEPLEGAAMLAPGFQTSGFWNCTRINFGCFKLSDTC